MGHHYLSVHLLEFQRKRFKFEFRTTACINNFTDFNDSKVANKL